jgi:rhamnosyltransferase
MQKNVFIIGSKGIPARYGGFETFVDKLTNYWKRADVKFHIACPKVNFKSDYEHKNARCFVINISRLGGFKSILYDLISLKECLKYIKKNNIAGPVIYMLSYRIGPFLFLFKQNIKKYNVKLYLNPDGLEYKRKKWNMLARFYWRISEKLTIQFCDLIICDSRVIQKIITDEFSKISDKIIYISYGAEFADSEWSGKNRKTDLWFQSNNIVKKEYYLIVGRFVPENNIELIINEYFESCSEKNLVFITNTKYELAYYNKLNKKFNLDKNKKILFPGTVYDKDMLKIIRENAFAYIHGHEVGGTNPSLLEALALTKINLVLRVAFNEEVCADSVLYFEKTPGSLKNLIVEIEKSSLHRFEDLSQKAKNRIKQYYSWDKVVEEYERIF